MQQHSRRSATSLPDLPPPRRQSGMRGSEYGGSAYDPRAPEARAYRAAPPPNHRPVSQPVLRSEPTAETADALRNLLDQHLQTVVAQTEAERLAQQAALLEEPEDEAIDPQTAELLEMLQAAEDRAALAEQQAIFAGQQAAHAVQQFSTHTSSAPPQIALPRDESETAARGSSFVTLGGWCAAALAIALAAGMYFVSYRPLYKQLDAQTKLTELQTHRSSETEAALRRSFDLERAALNEQLTAMRAVASAAASAAAATDASTPSKGASNRVASAKASKLEARAAKRRALLAKKAERAAKHEARAGKHKAHAAASADSDAADKAKASEPKHKSKPVVEDKGDDTGGNDPLEGL